MKLNLDRFRASHHVSIIEALLAAAITFVLLMPLLDPTKNDMVVGFYIFNVGCYYFIRRQFSRWEESKEIKLLHEFINEQLDAAGAPRLGHFLLPQAAGIARRLELLTAKLKAETSHWKANHDNQVAKARVLMERCDLPIERIQAYKRMEQLELLLEQSVERLSDHPNRELVSEINKALHKHQR